MQTSNNDSWKKKIYPAFDKPMKRYIEYLSQIENLPDDGQITFQDDFVELIKNPPDFPASYNHEFKKEKLCFMKTLDYWMIKKARCFWIYFIP